MSSHAPITVRMNAAPAILNAERHSEVKRRHRVPYERTLEF